MERNREQGMIELTQHYDWSSTPIGAISNWPISLTTLVNMILQSRFPMLLFWGPELTMFYNDAFRPSLGNEGKHPSSLGTSARDAWAELWDMVGPLLEGIYNGEPAVSFDDRLQPIYRDGQIRDVYWSYCYSPVTGDDGKVSGVLVTCTETTEKVESLARLTDTADRLTFTIDASELATWELNPNTHTFTTNRRLREWFGLPLDQEILHGVAVDRIPEPDRGKVAAAIERALRYEFGGIYDIEHPLINPVTGKTMIVHAVGRTIFDENQKPIRFNGTIQDVTKERLAQRRLEATEASLRQAIDLANLGTWHVNVDTNFTSMSPLLMDWFGADGEGADAATLIGCIREDQREMVANALYSTLQPGSDGIYDVEYTVVNAKTGQHRILHVLGESFFDNNGKPLRISGIAQDVTIERQLQLALENEVQARTEELEASNTRLIHSNEELAQFAYIASHDLQEPLRKISTYSQMLEKDLGQNIGDISTNYLSKIRSSSLRMTTLINDVLNYSKLGRENEKFTSVDLNQTVKNILADFDLLIEQKNAKVIVDQLPTIEAIPLQMAQLFRNLVSNALKFTRDGVAPQLLIKAEALKGEYKITVSDNGIGIAPEYGEKIFHIFQRLHSKSTYEGTGIGLAMVRKIAQYHNGNVSAAANETCGTTFTVLLPAKQPRTNN